MSTKKSLHKPSLAGGCAEAGFAVHGPDLRGHAYGGRLGDISYSGQLDHGLDDLMQIVRRDHPQASIVPVCHSSGGGIVFRIAKGPDSGRLARRALLAPALHYGAPTWRPNAGGWAVPFVPRIIALWLLHRVGVDRFRPLPVAAFAVTPNVPIRLAPAYSFVVSRNFTSPPDDIQCFGQMCASVALLEGARSMPTVALPCAACRGPPRISRWCRG